ncbi:MAG: hypothetical protein ABIR91_03110 [Candidatus Saccharimonadales bacterium]
MIEFRGTIDYGFKLRDYQNFEMEGILSTLTRLHEKYCELVFCLSSEQSGYLSATIATARLHATNWVSAWTILEDLQCQFEMSFGGDLSQRVRQSISGFGAAGGDITGPNPLHNRRVFDLMDESLLVRWRSERPSDL